MAENPEYGYGVDFGSRNEWVELFEKRVRHSDTLELIGITSSTLTDESDRDIQQKMDEALALLQGGTLLDGPMPTTDEGFEAILNDLEEKKQRALALRDSFLNRAATDGIGRLEHTNAADAALRDYDALTDRIRQKEFHVGRQLELVGSPVPAYIGRVIGNSYPQAHETWTRIRGAIEVFRFVTNETRDSVVLGQGTSEAWSPSALSHTVFEIQHLQALQIARAKNPMGMARTLGRNKLLANVGRPPAPDDENMHWGKGTWLDNAVKYLQSIEPGEGGLLVDKDATTS